MGELLGIGNSAKLYCLNWLDRYLNEQQGRAVSILDLGCGTAGGFIRLLKRHPQARYVGVEPLKESCLQAQKNLQGLNGSIINEYAYHLYDKLKEKFDIVISWSALEHVYRRYEFLRSAADCLKDDGYFLINYDSGHFFLAGTRDRVKNVIGPILARFGFERYYQSFVREQDFLALVDRLGLKVVDVKFFNTQLKGVYKVIPDGDRPEYMRRWYDFELWMNELPIKYDDLYARTFFTRNFILTHK